MFDIVEIIPAPPGYLQSLLHIGHIVCDYGGEDLICRCIYELRLNISSGTVLEGKCYRLSGLIACKICSDISNFICSGG